MQCLEDLGFTSGKASPCCFYQPAWKCSLVVHGDDFTALGLDDALDKLEVRLKASFEIDVRGRIGEHSPLKEMRILNGIVTLTEKGILYEADPQHAELLVRIMAVTNSVTTPGVSKSHLENRAPKVRRMWAPWRASLSQQTKRLQWVV